MAEATLGNISQRLASEVSEKTSEAAKSIRDASVKKIKSLTVDPIRSLMTPSGLGGVVALATKSPLAGLATSTLLEGTGKVAKSFLNVGKIVSGEVRESASLEAQPQDIQTPHQLAAQTKTLDDIWDILSYLVEIEEMQTTILIDEQQVRMQSSLKQLEQMREDGRLQEAFMDGLMEGMQAELDASKDILEALELNAKQNELSALEGVGLAGVGGMLLGMIKKVVSAALKAAVIVPFVVGIWDGIKAAWDEYISGGGVSQILGKAFSRTISGIADFLSFGVIDKEVVNRNFDLLANSIGRLGEALFSYFTSIGETVTNKFTIFGDNISQFGNNLVDSITEKTDKIVAVWDEFSIEDTWHKFVKKLSTLFETMQKNVLNWVNEIPLIGRLVTTEAEREKELLTLQKEEEELINRIRQLQARNVDPGDGLMANLMGYTEAERQQDLIDLAEQIRENRMDQNKLKPFRAARGGIFRSATHTIIGEAQDELVTPLHRLDDLVVNPAIAQTLQLVQSQNENRMLMQQATQGKGGGQGVIAPINNTVVTQQQATPFVAPVSRRNNENTFQRSLDKSYTRKPI